MSTEERENEKRCHLLAERLSNGVAAAHASEPHENDSTAKVVVAIPHIWQAVFLTRDKSIVSSLRSQR